MMRSLLILAALLIRLSLLSAAEAIPDAGGWRHEELRRFPAAEANQGVAVDAQFFYAIDNHAIGKYRKDTGERVATWQGEKDGRIKHLNAGIVRNGRLYCAHSNYPQVPMQSSVEMWDTADLKYLGQHYFTNDLGSLTWVDPRGSDWLACFAHYKATSDPARSRVALFDANWQLQASWAFPAELVKRFSGNSSSGGAIGPSGFLFVTGHDAKELYVLSPPTTGQELKWQATIPISAAGQAFCWDPVQPGGFYSISRKTREVIVSHVYSKLSVKP